MYKLKHMEVQYHQLCGMGVKRAP